MGQFDVDKNQDNTEVEVNGSLKVEDFINTPEDIKKILDFVNQPDYDFYKEIWEESTEEEFEEFCKEFPEARMVVR